MLADGALAVAAFWDQAPCHLPCSEPRLVPDVEFVFTGYGLGPHVHEPLAKTAVMERASFRYGLRLKLELRDSRGLEPDL